MMCTVADYLIFLLFFFTDRIILSGFTYCGTTAVLESSVPKVLRKILT